jgi:hypothetical protein
MFDLVSGLSYLYHISLISHSPEIEADLDLEKKNLDPLSSTSYLVITKE